MTSIATTDSANQGLLASAAKSGGTSGADFNMFLKLLTTQMQNQDPLDPMDTSEYTQQLVQYSQVEQSVQQTKSLKEILARLSAQDMAQASTFIGREARFDSPLSGLGASTPADWAFQPQRPAASMVATVTDATGQVVHRADLDPATGRYSWDGVRADGKRAPAGAYSLSIAALDAAGSPIPVSIGGMGIVRDVLTDGGAVTLGLNGIRLPLQSLVAVSAAP
jgi:flagellar basal-body rod modification protein FlgD